MISRFCKTIFIAVSILFLNVALVSAMQVEDPAPGGSSIPQMDDKFDQGWVDWFENDQIVINDTQFKITHETRVYDKNESPVNPDYLSVDMEVIFIADDDYRLAYVREKKDPDGEEPESLSMSERRIPQLAPEEDAQSAPAATEASGEMFQEGGVWKN